MSDTSMVPEPATRAPSGGETRAVKVATSTAEPAVTAHTAARPQMFPVRVSNREQTILMRVDTEMLREQRAIEAANESVYRRSRGQ